MAAERKLTITQALDTLSLPLSASPDDIHAAYRTAARRTHPDHNPGNPQLARQQFDRVQEAYKVLTDPAVIAKLRLATATGPQPPYAVDQLDAFRTLGLGPRATYDEIDARLMQLLRTEVDAGKRIDIQAAHERLTKPHRDTQQTFGASNRPRSDLPGTRPKQLNAGPSGMAALLFVVIGLGLVFGGVLLITTRGHVVIAEIAMGVGLLACLVGAVRWVW